MSSAVEGRYQNVSVVVPVGGTASVCDRLLSPLGCCCGWTVPTRAELVPEWTCTPLAVGTDAPPVVQELSPLSNPPLSTWSAAVEGVTALELADSGPLPAGFEAVTVNV